MKLYDSFLELLSKQPNFSEASALLKDAVYKNWVSTNNGNLPKFIKILNRNKAEDVINIDLLSDAISIDTKDPDIDNNKNLYNDLKDLMPWRKGPFRINNIDIDSEWKCDIKWNRLESHVNFKNKNILDIGSGNGYYALKIAGRGASTVTAIDPSHLSVVQFHYINKYMNVKNVSVLPIPLEDIPYNLPCWDVALSMGVLYHRKSPLDHLESIKYKLVLGGELIIETLVIKGDANSVLVPENRYAMMNNIYFLPSTELLKLWLRKTGFINIKVLDESYTTIEEQRSTSWKPGTSLKDYLDPINCKKTIEGHPAPLRVTIYAEKPGKNIKLPRYKI